MKNEDYFEYVAEKSFADRLSEFGYACESTVRNAIRSSENGIGKENREWYLSESRGQGERADWLFKNLIKDYEAKGDKLVKNTMRFTYEEVIDLLGRYYDLVEDREYSAHLDGVEECIKLIKELAKGKTVDEVIADKEEVYEFLGMGEK